MKQNMILIFGILILIGCKEQKEKVAKLIFDASKMSNRTDYFYSYNSDRLLSQTEKTYTIMFGQVVDSMITQVDYEYDEKGLLIKEISQADFEDKPTIKIFDYDKNDSLISEISINQENDTTFWEVYKYFPDGRKTVFHRFLSMHFDPNQDIMEAMENKKLDTSLFRNEFEYAGDLCKTQRQFDKKGNLIKTINFDYNGTQLISETHLTYFNDMEIIEKVKTYDYSKSEINPDYFSIDVNNDTLEFKINIFNSEKLIKTAYMFDHGNVYNEEYYENGLLIGTIDYDKQFTMNKIIYLYEYDKDGILKAEKIYREKITHTNTR